MGQLRTGILNLQKTCLNLEPGIQTITDQQDEFHQRIFGAGKRIGEGLNALVAYLIEKFKKDNTTFEAEGAKTLKDVADGNVMTLVKGVGTAKTDVKGIITNLAKQQGVAANQLHAEVQSAFNEAIRLKGLAEKKKGKLLKSAKYKAKIGGYLTALDSVVGILQKQSESIKAVAGVDQNDAWVDRCYKLSADMTVKQIRGLADTEFNDALKKFDTSGEKVGGYARKFRDEYKAMGSQLAIMKKWAEDADGMETEADEK